MKIKASEFKAFTKKLKISKKDVVINFSKDGIRANVNSDDIVNSCGTHLAPTEIKDYQAIGKVGIRNIHEFRKYVLRFKNFIHFTIKDNYVVLRSANRAFEDSVVDIDLIKETTDLRNSKTLKYEYNITLNQADIKELIGDGEALNEPKAIFRLKGDKLFIKLVSDLTKVKSFIKAPGIPEGVDIRTKVQHIKLVEILKNIDSLDCQLSIIQDAPIRIIEKDGNLTTTYFCTPMVDDKAKKTKSSQAARSEDTTKQDEEAEEVDLE